MKATVCPTCLSGSLEFVVVFDGESCRRCGNVPEMRLTPREIRACIKAKLPTPAARGAE